MGMISVHMIEIVETNHTLLNDSVPEREYLTSRCIKTQADSEWLL